MTDLHKDLLREKDHLSTEEIWIRFKDTLTTSVQTYVPLKKAYQNLKTLDYC